MINNTFEGIGKFISNDEGFSKKYQFYCNEFPFTKETLNDISMVMFNLDVSRDIKILKNGNVSYIEDHLFKEISNNAYLISLLLFRGKTIVFNHLEKKHSPFYSLFHHTLNIEKKLIHFNLYWSPPGSIGAGAHKDSHDVIILQLVGIKKWVIESTEILLSPGDVLYIKKGTSHNPSTTLESDSIHLTIGVKKDNLSYNNFSKEELLSYELFKEDNMIITKTIRSILNNEKINIYIPQEITKINNNGDLYIKNGNNCFLISSEESEHLFQEKEIQKEKIILKFKDNLPLNQKKNTILSLIKSNLPFSMENVNNNQNN